MSGLALHNILEANKLVGPNYNDWLRNVKLVLAIQKVAYVLETPLPVINEQSTADERAQADQWKQDELLAKCVILSSMNNELQRQHENLDSSSIMLRLKELYAEPDRAARYEISKELFGEKMKAKGKAKKSSKATFKSEDKCYECGNAGHWKRNCNIYLEKIKKAKEAGPSGVYIVEINLSSKNSLAWVLDTGCVSHICISMQGLKNPRRLAKGEVDLRVGNKAKVAALAVGTYEIQLPTGRILELRNCFFVPALSRNLISISALCRTGFKFIFDRYGCSFSFKDELFGTGTLNDDLYFVNTLIEVYNVEQPTKRKRDDVNETYLWHCRLGHIGETRLSKLYTERLIEPDVFETYPTCEPCLKGKLTKSPFKGTGERAKELLELVHTDVCGPMSTTAKGGYSYFIHSPMISPDMDMCT
jgi:hypothetical protein